MNLHRIIGFGAALAAAPALAGTASLLPGIYTNEEQVELARAAHQPLPPWTGLHITAAAPGVTVQRIDAFGATLGAPARWMVRETADRVTITSGRCTRDFAVVPAGMTIINQSRACAATGGPTTVTAKGLAQMTPDGTLLELQRARAFTCSVTLPRADGKADGRTTSDVPIHDAGGRAMVASDDTIPRRVTLHLRHIAWPTPPQPASLALALESDGAETATASADPTAHHIGLRVGAIAANCALAPAD